MASNSPIKTVNDLDQQFAGQRQLFAQLALAFLVQRVDGNLALKVSGLASDFQAELLGLLNQYYSRVAIYQALTTPLTESGDQWLVATGFKGFPVDDVLEPVTRATWFDFSTQTLQNWSTATNSRFPVSVFNWGPLMEEFKNILDNASQQLMTQRLTYLRTLAAHARGERQMDQVEQQSLQRTQAIKWAQDFLAPEDYDHQLLLPPTIN